MLLKLSKQKQIFYIPWIIFPLTMCENVPIECFIGIFALLFEWSPIDGITACLVMSTRYIFIISFCWALFPRVNMGLCFAHTPFTHIFCHNVAMAWTQMTYGSAFLEFLFRKTDWECSPYSRSLKTWQVLWTLQLYVNKLSVWK